MNFVIIVGSVRSERQGIKAARFIERSFVDRGHTVTLIDPIEQQLPRRFSRFASEFEWYADALREARAKGVPC